MLSRVIGSVSESQAINFPKMETLNMAGMSDNMYLSYIFKFIMGIFSIVL